MRRACVLACLTCTALLLAGCDSDVDAQNLQSDELPVEVRPVAGITVDVDAIVRLYVEKGLAPGIAVGMIGPSGPKYYCYGTTAGAGSAKVDENTFTSIWALKMAVAIRGSWQSFSGSWPAVACREAPSGDDTVWAKGYPDDAFRSIKIGMTRQEVHALLGPPLEIRQSYNQFDFDTIRQRPGEIVECWTTTPNDSSYRIRQVVFSGDHVVDKQAEFYVD